MAKSKTTRANSSSKSSARPEPTKGLKFGTGPRPFWTGVVSFGLVTLPVSLYPASRGKNSGLVMVDKTGTRLNRRYKCSKEQVTLRADDIIRGYEVEKDQFVTVDDDELKALAPEKSNEINLERFVSLDEINPIYFDKGYFLAPDADAIKAYRLLAESMEKENRAGIATFVMREREYLVAIVAQAGILRAETLRFHDEIRSPDDVGLGPIPQAQPKLVQKLQKALKALATDKLDREKLTDDSARQLLQKVQEKLQKNEGVIQEQRSPARHTNAAESEDDVEDSADIIDLMQVIKARIRGDKQVQPAPQEADLQKQSANKTSRGTAENRPRRGGASNERKKQADVAALERLNRDELYQQAQSLDINGRSKMTKAELLEAILKH